MRKAFTCNNLLLWICVLITLLASVPSVCAQQAGAPVNPTASAATEQQLLDQLYRIEGRGTIPDKKSYVLEQPAGRQWQVFHEVYLHWIAGIAIFGILSLLCVFYLSRGPIRFEGGRSGRKMVRFTAFERFVHWMTAVCFIALALSGMNFTFGKRFLLPQIGPEAFTTWSQYVKYVHNYLSFPFTIGVVLMFLMWVASNLPTRADVEWMKKGGGMFGGEEPPAHKFNAGEKLIFWIVVLGGGVAAASGYMLLFPFYEAEIAGMQLSEIIHSVVGVLYIAAMLVHTYMGTIGMKGAFEGMANGKVDVNWMRAHHSLWYEKVLRTKPDRIPPEPTATPAE